MHPNKYISECVSHNNSANKNFQKMITMMSIN